jgi:ribosomal 50S subunit-recycling heat shock protein
MPDVTIAEAAKAVGKSDITIRGLVNQGKLKSYKEKGKHRVDLNDVLALFANRLTNDVRIGASSSELQSNDEKRSLTIELQSRIKSLEDDKEYLKQLLQDERETSKKLILELSQRTSELKAFLENKSGLFKFLNRTW